jgi:hypothetical protein
LLIDKRNIFIFCLIVLALLAIAIAAFCQEGNTSSSQIDKMAVGDVNNDGKIDSTDVPENSGDLAVAGSIKVNKELCIAGDCKSKWPSLKCAEFDNRPKGETGDDFCSSQGKVCMGVMMGSGNSFFNECSTAPNSVHKTRCCWSE